MATRPTIKQLQAEIAALKAQLASAPAQSDPAPRVEEKKDDFVATAEQPFRKTYFFHLVGCAARVLADDTSEKDKDEIRRAMNEVATKFGDAAKLKLHSKIYAFARNGSAQRPQ